MKKILLLLIPALIIGLAGCKKDKNKNKKEKAPESYSQKVVLEYFSGAWCGYCPDGIVFSDKVEKSVGKSNFITYCFHSNDQMASESGNIVINYFKPAYPTGMINRHEGKPVNRGAWENRALTAKSQKALCGLRIDASTKVGENYKVTVGLGIGPNDLPFTSGNYLLSVFAIAKELKGSGNGWDQVNNYDSTVGHPYFGKGNPIINYPHKNVVLYVLTNPLGNVISPNDTKGGIVSNYDFTLDLKGQPISNVEIVAIISELHENNSTIISSKILNARKVAAGAKNDFN